MKDLIIKLKMARAFFSLVKDPRKTENIFEIADAARDRRRKAVEISMKPILENEAFLALWNDRYRRSADIKTLRSLPEGSFGRKFAHFLDDHHFQADAFPLIAPNSPLDYFASRMRSTHDLWHVLTGYETTISDELALQAFSLAQVKSPLSAMIIAGGLLHLVIFKPAEVTNAFELISQGYLRGKACQNLVTIRLEDYWETSLPEVRAELGLA